MQIRSITPNLMVSDVNATVQFYEQFGFTLVNSVPSEGTFDWAMMQAGDVALMFQQTENLRTEYPDLQAQQPGGSLTFYVGVSDVTGLYEQLKDQPMVIKPLHKTFYGADEFAIRDLNGFILTIAGQND